MNSISRRQFVSASALLTAGASSAAQKRKIVVTGGHPGDPEYGCGGAIARYTDLGHEVVLLYLNRGEKSCPEKNPDRGSMVRVAEAQRACSLLKARAVFAGQCDGAAIVDSTV